jgi:hypothetical protein
MSSSDESIPAGRPSPAKPPASVPDPADPPLPLQVDFLTEYCWIHDWQPVHIDLPGWGDSEQCAKCGVCKRRLKKWPW